jgi:hypothetical protein
MNKGLQSLISIKPCYGITSAYGGIDFPCKTPASTCTNKDTCFKFAIYLKIKRKVHVIIVVVVNDEEMCEREKGKDKSSKNVYFIPFAVS